MPGWNMADVWEVIAEQIPDAQALVHGDTRRTWKEFDERADGVAAALLDAGLQRQDKVAQYLYNCNEYIESLFACFKASLVPVNTNYRYTRDELLYLWDNADAAAVVFHGSFAETIDDIRDKLPGVRVWLWVDDGSGPCPEWAVPYEEAATSRPGRVVAPGGRDGDDLFFLYTGGTTGMPKGVMWRQDDLVVRLGVTSPAPFGDEVDLDAVRAAITQPGLVGLPACPLMHGTGSFTSMGVLLGGGSVVTLTNRRFDVVELLETIGREGVAALAIVGDAFAKPMLRALDENPGRYDISSLMMITSSGVMWSEETKQGLLRHNPNMLLVDVFSSSEALGMGQSVSSGAGTARTAKFQPGEDTIVIDEEGRRITTPGVVGRLGVGGRQPLGYYKDETKTAATFLTVEGRRYSVPGDFAVLEDDGSVRVLGRGSVCINTGGEKVFPEEVEEVLKKHPAVADAVVVGVPDERFGEAVTAMVERQPGAEVTAEELIAHTKEHLAGYKAPRRVFFVDSIGRAPNGKVDYRRLREEAIALSAA